MKYCHFHLAADEPFYSSVHVTSRRYQSCEDKRRHHALGVVTQLKIGMLYICVHVLWLKPGSHERHKYKQRKQRMNSPLRLAKTKQREFFFVSPFVLLFAYAWTMILCLCL